VTGERHGRDIVVVGASLGGVQALRHLIECVPAAMSGSLFLVLHRGAHASGALPKVLGGRSPHAIIEPVDMQPIAKGRIYLAPRDAHMTIEDGHLRVLRGPKEHFTRPAVDPLFRSAATAYGPRVVGVVLTGGGHDGLSGLLAIKSAGGLALVQRPSEAQSPSMPAHAIMEDRPDAVMTLDQIGSTIASLMNGAPSRPIG
jgi:two-component system chemotaxis response regulator CheB